MEVVSGRKSDFSQRLVQSLHGNPSCSFSGVSKRVIISID